MKTTKEKWPALYAGLNQIPTKDLKRLLKEIDTKPDKLVFTGAVLSGEKY